MEQLLDTLDQYPLLLPLAIMLSRVVDVSIGTVRMIMVFRGRRYTAAVLGFFEVTIWLLAITGIIAHLTNVIGYLAYGLGFALGNVVGLIIEQKMAVGQQVVRFISSEEGENISRVLRSQGFGVTEFSGSGREGPVLLGFVIAPRKKVAELMEIISGVDPKSVVTIEDVRHSNIVEYNQRPAGGLWGWMRILKKK
ncbi:MAG: DUF2179 domain-containing protein [Candidatus Glassbacteria bacterium]|nr:DUF2179 domain-containing protein [Candidatus Glassbacteria bacterium]